MEHDPALLEKLSHTNAVVLVYDTKINLHKNNRLLKYVVKATYKGFDVILSFTNDELKKISRCMCVCEPKLLDRKSIEVTPNNRFIFYFKIMGCVHRVVMTESLFNNRICNRSVFIHDLLNHALCKQNENFNDLNVSVYNTDILTEEFRRLKCTNDRKITFHYYEVTQRESSDCITPSDIDVLKPILISKRRERNSLKLALAINYPNVFKLISRFFI